MKSESLLMYSILKIVVFWFDNFREKLDVIILKIIHTWY
jgi:hypothetical protein